ncbi:carbohydrate binding protein with CBM6 domain [Actinophytocola oryzae]|uniref:Carbohydrate binding protein with CBM6 domain n=2 Tax=Actinophytocola oryzae TaxID=502181 RepID=A0A4R7VI30_9PSEU|nr:carbohydrate binding protein with CBM6 domain [Actinophytocola oryzae]
MRRIVSAVGAISLTVPLMVVSPASVPAATSGYVGVTFGFDSGTLRGAPYDNQGNRIYNVPMFRPTGDLTVFWDNYVEQLVTAGVDFVAVNTRGYVPGSAAPSGSGDPRILGGLVAAINRRGVAGQLKIAAFDDTPASLTDKKNQVKHHTGGYEPKFDLGDATGAGEGGYQYYWDYNLREFYRQVPDSVRFKLDGRPLVYEWSIGDFAFSNQGNGNASRLLQYVRSHAQSEFGFNPYIVVDQNWPQEDPTTVDNVDGVDNWFGVPGPGYTQNTFKNNKYGVAVPGFRFVSGSTNMVIDPRHGQTYAANLAATAGSGAKVTLIEGFTDWQENAAVMRTAEGGYDQRLTDYPNQMLNITRRYSRTPFPSTLRIEAESADSVFDTTSTNTLGTYRDGSLDVERTPDSGGGWDVGATAAGEWLEWKELPIQGTVRLRARVATPNTGATLRFLVDGRAGPTVTVPNTGNWQTYQTVDAGSFTLPTGSYHTVRVEFPNGNLNLNFWTASP